MKSTDTLIIGAGAAGLFAAITAAQSGASVIVLEKNARAGNKILISGGGRCNFTNLNVTPENYVSTNPHFCKSALNQYTQQEFIKWIEAHNIAFHEKHMGQLFCDTSSKLVLAALLADCSEHNVNVLINHAVTRVNKTEMGFEVFTEQENFNAKSIVITSGGLSFAKLGVSGIGYDIAKQFGHTLIPTTPGLTPVIFDAPSQKRYSALAGLSLPVLLKINSKTITDDMLFTHSGLSGPAILTASNYIAPPCPLIMDLLPNKKLPDANTLKETDGKKHIDNYLAQFLPRRLAEFVCDENQLHGMIEQLSSKPINALFDRLHRFEFAVSRFDGYDKAEVTRGGVDTNDVSSKTMESKLCPGLFFAGEVLDVTGDLGGFNFQWAWSSGFVAGKSVVF